jgi:hypothetical protein
MDDIRNQIKQSAIAAYLNGDAITTEEAARIRDCPTETSASGSSPSKAPDRWAGLLRIHSG